MSAYADFLLELGCEELPAKQVEDQARLLFDGLAGAFDQAGLDFDREASRRLATPRRLTVIFAGLAGRQPDRRIDRKGPAVSVAFDADGNPTQAAEGFARSVGLPVDQLERLENEQGEWLFARIDEPGKALAELLPAMLESVMKSMAGARSMRWGDRTDRFLRPVRWLVALYGKDILPLEIMGLTAGRETRGHRVHAPGPHPIAAAADYETVLENARVIADPAVRRERIASLVADTAQRAGLDAHPDPDLLSEVANLVEWPQPVLGTFDTEFLAVPPEALVASMQQHQKTFPLFDDQGNLSNRFVAIANIDSTDPDAMRAGFERVIRPRLADAKFFWDQDRKRPIDYYRKDLSQVVYQEKLGSLLAKVTRVEALAAHTADRLKLDDELINTIGRAAHLSKCDLLTEMVGEFPELQGTMGRYYALESGESKATAKAIESHYLPRFSGDQLPDDKSGQVVSLADRVDTLVWIFAAGLKPKGNKDPFALRRAALGLVRVLVECRLELDFETLISIDSAYQFDHGNMELDFSKSMLDELRQFIFERFRTWASEQGIETNTFHAVNAGRLTTLADFMDRARAVQAFADDESVAGLIAANKRIKNLLEQAGETNFGDVDESSLQEDTEKHLFKEVAAAEKRFVPLCDDARYEAALAELAGLRDSVDAFFDGVMVMTEDATLRRARLALLARMRKLFTRIADVALLGR